MPVASPGVRHKGKITTMGCFEFLKVMMFIFNSIIFLAGAGILAVGVWVKVDSGSLLGLLGNLNNSSAGLSQIVNVGYLLIAIGGVLLIMGFLGCCGAIRENKCLLLTFFIILLIIFIAEVAAAVVILAFKPLVANVINVLGSAVVTSIKNEYGKNVDVTGPWNLTMISLKCCGFNNFTDFTGSPFYQRNNTYPDMCCSTYPCTYQNAANATLSGCFRQFVTLVEKNTVILVGVAFGIAALELSAMIVSMTLYCKIGKK
ncbi:tetraspanin-1-like [Arapaima gigas]